VQTMFRRRIAPQLALLAGMVLCGCGAGTPAANTPAPAAVQGQVRGGLVPVTGATIQLYAVGTTGDGSASTPLLTSTVTADSSGNFTITGLYTCPTPTTWSARPFLYQSE